MEQAANLQEGFTLGSTLSKAASTLVRVTNGVHEGAKFDFDDGSVTIGSEADNDMVLFADNLCPHHCRLDRKRNPLAPITIYALDGAVILNGRQTINPGEYVSVKGKFTLDMANTRLTISPAVEYSSYATPALKLCLLAAILLVAWIGWGIVSNLFYNVASVGADLGSVLTNKTQELASTINPEPKDNEKLVWTIRAKLEELQLNAAIRANTMSDGNIHLTGVLTNSQSPRWNEFLRWYDTNPTFPTLIKDVRKNAKDAPVPQIESVWLNGKPTVHFKSGKKANVGDDIGDGWKVDQIDRNGVSIIRDGSKVLLKF